MLCILLFLFLCILLFLTVRSFHSKDKEKKVETPPPSENIDTSKVDVQELVINSTEPSDSEAPVSITVSSMGDCTLGTDVNFAQSTSLPAY